MLLALLPALTLGVTGSSTGTGTSATEHVSETALRDAVAAGVRAALASGWTLVDVDELDEGVAFTLSKRGQLVRHVASFDGGTFYRIEPGSTSGHVRGPSQLLLDALRGDGGFEIEPSCGTFYLRPYVNEQLSFGPQAHALVARSLASAADLESVSFESKRAVFHLEARSGEAVDLTVQLADDGSVVSAELRRFEVREDHTMYRRRGALVKALDRAVVVGIEPGPHEPVLVTSRGRFEIDPDASAFRQNRRDEGCGC